MKNNIPRLIGSVIVFCLSVGAVFGYALYGAGKKSAQDSTHEQQMTNDLVPISQSSASVQTTSVQPAVQSVAQQNNSSFSGEDEDEDDEEGDDSDSNQTSSVPTKPVSNPVSTVPADTRKQVVYKNGTYTAIGSYRSPAGTEQISVTVTLVNNIITKTSAVSMANDRTSERYEQKFIGGYAALIVGKNIDTVQLSYVSGSSLTSGGFNDALAKIKVSARA